jgi:photosystem II PsbY protein
MALQPAAWQTRGDPALRTLCLPVIAPNASRNHFSPAFPAPSRSFGTISLLFIPALAWVGFNMLGPLNNQLNRMNELASDSAPRGKRRGIAGAVGLGAALSLAAAQQADAATELAQLAGSDGR